MTRRSHGLLLVLSAILAALVLSGCSRASTPEDSADKPATAPASDTQGEAQPGEAAPAEMPPAPADVSGMQAWFSAAYPDAAWLKRIKKIEYVAGEVPDSGGFANAIVVTTDLDFAGEQAMGDEINAALGEAHPGWAKQFVIKYADGANITAGDIFDRTP